MFLASYICWVDSDTVCVPYCCEPLDVRARHDEAEPMEWNPIGCKFMNVCITLAMVSLRQVVTPDIARETRWLRSAYVGVSSFSVRKHII